jgi:hypothetical protein
MWTSTKDIWTFTKGMWTSTKGMWTSTKDLWTSKKGFFVKNMYICTPMKVFLSVNRMTGLRWRRFSPPLYRFLMNSLNVTTMGFAKHPLFPHKVEDLVADLNTKQAYLRPNGSRLGISSAELTGMDALLTAMNTAQARVNNRDTRTKIDTAQRNEAIEEAKKGMRRLICNYVVFNRNATTVDMTALHVPPPGPFGRLPAPDEEPGIGHITSSDDIISVPFYDAQSSYKRGKPEGAQAIEAYMKIGGDPPVSIDEMTERRVSTASPMKIKFGPDMDGVTVYFRFRWVGTRGDCGQWSEVYKVIVTQ